jgi:hypothetical protein
MGTIRSAKRKRDVGPECLALAFFQKGSVSLYNKLFSVNPAPILEPPQVSAPIGTANPTSQNRRGAFFHLEYTFDFKALEINAAKKFEPAGDSRYNQPLGEIAGKDTIDEDSDWRRPGRIQI